MPIINKKDILSAAVKLVRTGGMESLNARSLARSLNCSTKPLFRIYQNMNDLKEDVIEELNNYYNSYMEGRMSQQNRLLTQSIAYIEFARQEKHIFNTLFMDKTCAGKSIDDILRAEWNQPSILNAKNVTGLNMEQTRCLFRDVWLYSHGIATQIVANAVDLPYEKVVELMNNAFQRFSLVIEGEKQ
ncbi:TetR/AcrR family transcriptional regulator [Sporolactobacillus shoreicorticis]|uniref:TetR/AcrR family transcriptional regulator n=1 Tax=Sporolactobacillus shoreicorticis TaxID=1923877 RepID=A0ABW5S3M7_9BACL